MAWTCLPACHTITRGVGGRVLRTRAGALALLLVLLALIEGWRLWQPEAPAECECESQQCFDHQKESALRGSVARARRKYTPRIQELEQQLAALRANQTIPTPAAVPAATPAVPYLLSSPPVAAGPTVAPSAGRIPRILHQTWKTSDIPPELQKYVDSWAVHNDFSASNHGAVGPVRFLSMLTLFPSICTAFYSTVALFSFCFQLSG